MFFAIVAIKIQLLRSQGTRFPFSYVGQVARLLGCAFTNHQSRSSTWREIYSFFVPFAPFRGYQISPSVICVHLRFVMSCRCVVSSANGLDLAARICATQPVARSVSMSSPDAVSSDPSM